MLATALDWDWNLLWEVPVLIIVVLFLIGFVLRDANLEHFKKEEK